MSQLETLRGLLPDTARDIKLNLQSVLTGGALTNEQRWGVAVACGYAAGHDELTDALVAEAAGQVAPQVLEDARAAATLMAMNNVYYRFRHMVGKDSYGEKPARLRMNRLVQVATNKVDFELFSLAVSALNACEMCVRSHEKAVLDGGLSEDHVHDAVRIAATIAAAAVGLQTRRHAAGTQAA